MSATADSNSPPGEHTATPPPAVLARPPRTPPDAYAVRCRTPIWHEDPPPVRPHSPCVLPVPPVRWTSLAQPSRQALTQRVAPSTPPTGAADAGSRAATARQAVPLPHPPRWALDSSVQRLSIALLARSQEGPMGARPGPGIDRPSDSRPQPSDPLSFGLCGDAETFAREFMTQEIEKRDHKAWLRRQNVLASQEFSPGYYQELLGSAITKVVVPQSPRPRAHRPVVSSRDLPVTARPAYHTPGLKFGSRLYRSELRKKLNSLRQYGKVLTESEARAARVQMALAARRTAGSDIRARGATIAEASWARRPLPTLPLRVQHKLQPLPQRRAAAASSPEPAPAAPKSSCAQLTERHRATDSGQTLRQPEQPWAPLAAAASGISSKRSPKCRIDAQPLPRQPLPVQRWHGDGACHAVQLRAS
jgi:hypothetical protein